MPKNILELVLEYKTTTNAVTRWALRESIKERISRSEVYQLNKYLLIDWTT